MFSKRKDAGFPFGCTDLDAAAVDGRRGSNVYEVNPWLWRFGCGNPRLGDLSIEQTAERKGAAASDARHKRAAEPKRDCETAQPDLKLWVVYLGMYHDVHDIYQYIPICAEPT